jgi:ParB-like chromosome segregation protein Spo0J
MGFIPNITRTIQHIRLDLIDRDPRQPRESFDETEIAELALSIKNEGLIQLPDYVGN